MTQQRSQPLNILIRGYYNTHNLGDDLLLLALLEFFQHEAGYTPDTLVVWLESREKSLDKLGYKHPFPVQFFSDPWKQWQATLPGWLQHSPLSKVALFANMLVSLVLAGLYRFTGWRLGLKNWFAFLAPLDVIHYAGGGYFNTRLPWGLQLLLYELFFTAMARLLKPEITILGTGMGLGPVEGPVRGTLFRWIAKPFFEGFRHVFVREAESARFLESIQLSKPYECLSDDVLLLGPYFQSIQPGNQEAAEQHKPEEDTPFRFGLNLKFDEAHRYENFAGNLQALLATCKRQGLEPTFFDFSQDHKALKQLPKEVRDALPLYSCYSMGLAGFIAHLRESRYSLGFAYHFAILAAMLQIPAVSCYYDSYYKQKTNGVLRQFDEAPAVLSFGTLVQTPVKQLIEQMDTFQPERLEQARQDLIRAYRQAYATLGTPTPAT